MKYFLQHPEATGRFDPPGVSTVQQTQGRVEKVEEADVIFIPEARFDGFRFDDKLNDIQKPWVLFSWSEFGWDDPRETSYLWSRDRLSHPAFQDDEWRKFDQFAKDHPPILTFQRELLAKDRSDRVQPIDYLAWLPEIGNDDRDTFLKRPFDVEFDFGRSHEARMWFHGAVFQNAGRFGYDVVSEFSHVPRALEDAGRKWLSVHVPHYARIDVLEVQKLVRQSTITVILPGAGQRTFRSGERCSDAIMAMPRHRLAEVYPWDASNSIVLPEIKTWSDAHDSCKVLADALMRTDLYELYCAATENALNFRAEPYCRRHIAANVERFL